MSRDAPAKLELERKRRTQQFQLACNLGFLFTAVSRRLHPHSFVFSLFSASLCLVLFPHVLSFLFIRFLYVCLAFRLPNWSAIQLPFLRPFSYSYIAFRLVSPILAPRRCSDNFLYRFISFSSFCFLSLFASRTSEQFTGLCISSRGRNAFRISFDSVRSRNHEHVYFFILSLSLDSILRGRGRYGSTQFIRFRKKEARVVRKIDRAFRLKNTKMKKFKVSRKHFCAFRVIKRTFDKL